MTQLLREDTLSSIICSGLICKVSVSVLEAPSSKKLTPASRHATSFTSNSMCISSQVLLG
jgi:hypothetical protein